MNAAEQRLMALVLTDERQRERQLAHGATIAGIDATAIRRFALSLERKRTARAGKRQANRRTARAPRTARAVWQWVLRRRDI